MVKYSLKHLSICQLYISFTMLWVIFKLSIVVCPFVSQLRKVLIVEIFRKIDWFHIINSSLTVKFIILPMAFVCNRSVLVVEFTETMHFIVLPFTIIVSSIFKIEDSMTIPLVIQFVSLVSTSVRNFLFNELKVRINFFSFSQRRYVLIARSQTFALTLSNIFWFWWSEGVAYCTSSLNIGKLFERRLIDCWVGERRGVNCWGWPWERVIVLLGKGVVFTCNDWRLSLPGNRI